MALLAPLTLLALLAIGFQFVECAKILAIFPFPGPSQFIAVLPYLKTLAARGHAVTVISAFPQKQKLPNYRDIPVEDVLHDYGDIIQWLSVERGKWEELSILSEFCNSVTRKVLGNAQVQQLLQSREQFDLIIVEPLQTDPLFGFAQHFSAALIGVSSFGTDRQIDGLVGNTSPLSYIPPVTSGLSDRMTFAQRLQNVVTTTVEWLHYHIVQLPQQQVIYKRYFPNARLGLLELRRNFSLVLLNQHFSLSYPRPYVPGMIEVGGFHVHKQTHLELTAEMAAFLDTATEGVIYFSMGSNIKSKNLPQHKLDTLLQTFASLPQRVMWKYEMPELPGKPDNVLISSWFPQQEILAHPNVKLFVTHGGLLSTIEAIHHGKPLVGIPVFYDQFLNVERAKRAGFGLGVDFDALSTARLRAAIEAVLHNASFARVAAKISRLYRDQPMAPMDTAIYWTEYVLRHQGAAHLRVASLDMTFMQYHSLDTMAVLIGSILLIVILSISLLKRVVRCLRTVLFGTGRKPLEKPKRQ